MNKHFKQKVIDQFSKVAEGYVRDRGFAATVDLDLAADLLKPTSDDIMLDVATGGGHTALYFSPKVRSVVASDLTMQMLKKAQEYITEEGGAENVTFREADAEDLPFPAGSFTLLTCRIAPHHFPDLPRALREFFRVLRRGGRMVVIDTLLPEDPELAQFMHQMEKMRDSTHIQAYTQPEWEAMVQDAGFILHTTKVFSKTHDFPLWAKRAGMNRDQVKELNQLLVAAPGKVHDFLQIETFAGEVESFTDRKILLFASRPDKK